MTGRPAAIALSSGEPAGIGPDICLMLAREALPARLAVLGDPTMLAMRARMLGLALELETLERFDAVEPHRPGRLQILSVPVAAEVLAGHPNTANARYVLEILRSAAQLCLARECDALVTAPVQKSIISQAGIPFSGHTEFLAETTGARTPVMLLVSGTLRVALATTHLALRRVPDALDESRLTAILEVLHRDLTRKLGVAEPRIKVLGLNPHAGESGTLGDEEQTILEPVIARLKARGLRISGPVPADTAFTPASLGQCDAVLAMFHDQGLPPIKALSFGEVVNVTLGLPIIRTSVDHGTALGLAGTGEARPDSLQAALRVALQMAAHAGRP